MADVLKVEGATKARRQSPLAGQLATNGVDVSAYAADSSGTALPGDSLKALQALAQELIDAEGEVLRKARALQVAADALSDIQERRLPDLLEEHGLPKFEFVDKTTGNHYIIKLETGWRVQMPPLRDKDGNEFPENLEKRKRIFEWFRSIGKGGIIKKEMTVPMGLMPDGDAVAIMTKLKELYPTLDPGLTEEIHHSTLKSQVRQLKDKEETVHEDIICTPIRKAAVQNKK
jgi:hypothetical protein